LFPLNQEGTLSMPSAPAFPGIPELPPPGNRLVEQLENLIQNERNGAVFYKNLAALAGTSTQAEILRGIGEGCLERGRSYNSLYRKEREADFEANENPVIGAQTLHQGLSLALREEENATRELIRLYESEPDGETRHVLSAQLYKKISDLGILHRLASS